MELSWFSRQPHSCMCADCCICVHARVLSKDPLRPPVLPTFASHFAPFSLPFVRRGATPTTTTTTTTKITPRRRTQRSHQSVYFSMRLNLPIQLQQAMDLNGQRWGLAITRRKGGSFFSFRCNMVATDRLDPVQLLFTWLGLVGTA